ncbi:MAG: sodium-dependent transporter [Candidatus Cryptobacteroides sp.]
MSAKRESFGSRMAVIFAMAGSAIGLGNIWRFPYMVGEHGGSVFILVYIVATLLISLPVFVAEVVIGRRSRSNANTAFSRLSGGRRFWKVVGFLPILIPLVIASYYSVIGGWSLDYLFKSCTMTFSTTAPEDVSAIFDSFTSNGAEPVLMHLLFLLATVIVVAGGVKSGIEKFSKVTLPVLFVLIVAIAIYSICLPGAGEGVRYLVKPQLGELTPRTFAYAMGQSFYSLSLGMGAIITYGSYVSKKENILASSAGTAVSDLLFAILAGFAIMPAVFASGLEPGAGPGLIFRSVPYVFATMGANAPVVSTIVAVLFFLAVVVAAMTSCISLVEVGVAYLVEKFGMKRPLASALIFVLCGGAGVLCALNSTAFDRFDWLSSNILLLLMALLVVIFVGFVMKKEDVRDEITNSGSLKSAEKIFPLVYFLIRWVAPVAVVLIFISNFIL